MDFVPAQYASANGTVSGAIDGRNAQFSIIPFPEILLYSNAGFTSHLLFRNGLLIDEYQDYAAAPGYFALRSTAVGDTLTALLYQGPAPSKLRLDASGSLTLQGTASLRLSPLTPAQSSPTATMMIFRNGQLLTNGLDYTRNGFWIKLLTTNAVISGSGDTYLAVIGLSASLKSTFSGTITGAVNGTNAVFTLTSFAPAIMLFRNGQFLTETVDYLRSGLNQIILLGAQIPQPGDVLSSQALAGAVQVQATTADGTLSYPVAAGSLLFRNAQLMTQPGDGSTTGNTGTFAPAQIPQPGDQIAFEAWTRDLLAPDQPAFNLPVEFSGTSITGVMNGVNNVFTLGTQALITSVMLWWNRNFLAQGVDYFLTGNVITMLTGQFPVAGDVLTAEVFLQ